MLLESTEKLIDWFWEHGTKRKNEFAISTSDWTKTLYDVRKELLLVREAQKQERPAFAIWGPSQTGKSTLVSAYIDDKAVRALRSENAAPEQGRCTALDWGGKDPVFFMNPEIYLIDKAKWPAGLATLNPFNLRADASACLSRFVLGSLTGEPNTYRVHSGQFPVEIKLVEEKDLLHALARGYDTECLGAPPTGIPTRWTIERFQSALEEVRGRARQGRGPVEFNRRAYELLHDLCEILDDLVFAELERYRELTLESEASWRSVLSSLLADKTLISSESLVEEFAAKVLWDGSPIVTEYYQKMLKGLREFRQRWQGKTIHASARVAALMLNMDACKVYYEPLPPNAGPGMDVWEIHDRIKRLACREEGARVFLDLHPELPNRLNLNAESFGILQGLVWELIIPLNAAHLNPQSSFVRFLKEADLLDFPGVGNDKTNIGIDVWSRSEAVEAGEGAEGEAAPKARRERQSFQDPLFFTKILKRGKTASMVSSYAKRLTIDGFSIFQNIDMHPPVNANQLRTGIHTWWKCMVPDYYHQQEGPSPLPLNLALCWWASLITEASMGAATVFGSVERIIQVLGKLRHPEVAVTFALNYWTFGRGMIKNKTTEAVLAIKDRIQTEPAFLTQFRSQISQQSFEQMMSDQETGGTTYFFEQLNTQVRQCRANPRFSRLDILKRKEEQCAQQVVKLLTEYNLFPPPAVQNARVQYLEELRDRLEAAVDHKPEKEMRKLNHAVREFLDIDYTKLKPVPRDIAEINEDFVRGQFQTWIHSRAERYQAWKGLVAKGKRAEPDWALLGVTGEVQLRRYLESMVASLDPKVEFKEIVLWLRKLAQYRGVAPSQVRSDLRPHLAVRMANSVVYSKEGIPPYDASSDDLTGFDDFDEDNPPPEPRGKKCLSYEVFIKPFLEAQLKWFIKRDVAGDNVPPPDLPGTEELKKLCQHYLADWTSRLPQSAEELKKLQTQLTAPQLGPINPIR